MANNNRVAGLLSFKVNGEVIATAAEGIEYCLGTPKQTAVMSATGVAGCKLEPQVPYISGKCIDSKKHDLRKVFTASDVSCVAELANGKTIMGSAGWYAGDGTASTDTGQFDGRWEFMRVEEI
jgi:trimethylamine:corrinoid methyltransferase-like protein